MIVTTEEALKQALLDIADYLERDEYYSINTDSIVHGEAIKPLLADFAANDLRVLEATQDSCMCFRADRQEVAR